MRNVLWAALIPLQICAVMYAPLVSAEQQARMSVTVVARGTDSTRSDGEWSKGTFLYRVSLGVTLQTDGELSEMNMYDPDYAQKSMAAAAASMAKIQAAMKGQFSDEEEVEAELRYLLYLGEMNCPVTLSIEVVEKLEGEYADVGGMQPYTVTFNATSSGTEAERNMLCVAGNSILDTKDNTLYRSTLGFPEVTGHYVLQEHNRGKLIDDKQAVHSALPTAISEYVFNTLRVAPAQGHEKTELKLSEPLLTRSGPFGNYEGSVAVELSWNFEPVK